MQRTKNAAGMHWGDHHFNDATMATILYNTIKSMEKKGEVNAGSVKG